MKTLLNTKNEKIEKFDNFDELTQYAHELFIENMITFFGNDISKYIHDEIIDFVNYANENKKMLSHIKQNAINLFNIYLITSCDNLFIAFMNDCDEFECYDFYEHEFDCVENIYKINYHNEYEMLQYIIDELNNQLSINEQQQIINEN